MATRPDQTALEKFEAARLRLRKRYFGSQDDPNEGRYVSPDSNLLKSGGYQPRPGQKRPKPPTTASGVRSATVTAKTRAKRKANRLRHRESEALRDIGLLPPSASDFRKVLLIKKN